MNRGTSPGARGATRLPLVPVTSANEFEAVMSRVLLRIDKVLYARGDPPRLKDARRTLDRINGFARDTPRLKEARPDLVAASEVVQADIADDEELRNMLWDLVDFIDYGAT